MSRAAIVGILRDLGQKRRRRRSERYFYAFSNIQARQTELPFLINKMHRLGASEIPSKARITPEDMDIARAEKPLPHPNSDDEAEHYKARLFRTDLYPNVLGKLKAFSEFSSPGKMMHWSIGQFVGNDRIHRIDPKHDYEQVYHDLYSHLPASRQRVHTRALEQLFNPLARARPGQDKNFSMIIGPPGAGKSRVGVPYAHTLTFNPNYTTINVDDTRNHLPEYEGWNSSPVHMEAAYLTYGALLPHALKENHHLIYDATGKNAQTMEKALQMAQNHGYSNHLILVHRPAFKTMAGTWDRFLDNAYGAKFPDKEPSRFIDPVWAYHDFGEKPKQTYSYLKTTPLLHTYTMLDPDTPKGEQPRILEHGRVRR